jgi:hypothetical protein
MPSASINRIWRIAFVSMFALGASLPALAQKAALVQGRDDPARNFYQVTGNCGSPTFQYCAIDFPAVPAGKRLIVTHLSMLNQMPAAGTISSIDLRISGGAILAFLPSTLNPGTAFAFNYSVNESVLAKFDTGDAPQLITFSTSAAGFTTIAVISGYMIDIP